MTQTTQDLTAIALMLFAAYALHLASRPKARQRLKCWLKYPMQTLWVKRLVRDHYLVPLAPNKFEAVHYSSIWPRVLRADTAQPESKHQPKESRPATDQWAAQYLSLKYKWENKYVSAMEALQDCQQKFGNRNLPISAQKLLDTTLDEPRDMAS